MDRSDDRRRLLVSFAAPDRDWAEWVGSHLDGLGYHYEFHEPPLAPGEAGIAAIDEARANGNDVVLVVSDALIDESAAFPAPPTGTTSLGPVVRGALVLVQIENLVLPADLSDGVAAPMFEAPNDYHGSRDLLVVALAKLPPRDEYPAVEPDELSIVDADEAADLSASEQAGEAEPAAKRSPLPAPVVLAPAYPVPEPAPAMAFTIDSFAGVAPASDAPGLEGPGIEVIPEDRARRGAGLLATNWAARPWQDLSLEEPPTSVEAQAATETEADDSLADRAPAAFARVETAASPAEPAVDEAAPARGESSAPETVGDHDSGAQPGDNAHDPEPDQAIESAESSEAAQADDTDGAVPDTTATTADAPEDDAPPALDARLDQMLANLSALARPGGPTIPAADAGMEAEAQADTDVAVDADPDADPDAGVSADADAEVETGAPQPFAPVASTTDSSTGASTQVQRFPAWLASDPDGCFGREATLDRLAEARGLLVLTGPAGIGTSTVAARHAAAVADSTDVVWWVRGRARSTAIADLRALAIAIGLEGTDAPSLVASLAEWLATTDDSWLVVIDGITAAEPLDDLIPLPGTGQASGKLLITASDLPTWFEVGGATTIELGPLSPGEAADFLQARTASTEREPIEALAGQLGGSPWVLSMAAASLGSVVGQAMPAGTIAAYRADLQSPPAPEGFLPLEDALGSPGVGPSSPANDRMALAAVLQAVRQLQATSTVASRTIAALASLAPVPLPRADIDRLSDPGTKITDLATTAGLVSVGDGSVVMSDATRSALTALRARETIESAVGFVTGLLRNQVSGDPLASRADLYAPHAIEALAAAERLRLASEDTARLAAFVRDWLRRLGQHVAALPYARQAAQHGATELGGADSFTVAARRSLAELYVELGDHHAALEVQAALVADTEASLGADAPETLRARANLAADHLLAGDADTAVVEAERAVAGLHALYGADHPESIAAADVLDAARSAASHTPGGHAAATSAALEAPVEPATLEAEGTAELDAGIGPEAGAEPDATTDAGLEADFGAESKAQPELASRPDDALPPVLVPSSSSADAGVIGEANGWHPPVPSDDLAATGAEQDAAPAYAVALHDQADALVAEGRYHEAAATLRQLVEVEEANAGPADLRTLTAQNDLANTLALAGDHVAALALLEQVVDTASSARGVADPGTLTAKHNLANSYADLGRHEDALTLRSDVLRERTELLGADHPQTVGARNNLANSYAELGRHEEALALRAAVVATREDTLGRGHPQTLGALNNLANSYADLGRHEEALALREEVLTSRERVLGADHPHTLTARNNLANSYAALGRVDEAFALRSQAVADCERVLGANHPHTLTARSNLANSSGAAAFGSRNGVGTLVNASAGPSANGHTNGVASNGQGATKRRRFWFFGRR